MSPCLRFFVDEVEALAPRWRERVFAKPEDWKEAGKPGSRGGTFGSFPVSGEGLGGMAKPRPQKYLATSEHPVAAIEKIASDLAFELNLPVPPAVLWHRPDAPRSHGRELVISAIPFLPAVNWSQVEKVPATRDQYMPLLSPLASAVLPFDTWIMNGDRENGGNLIVTEDVSGPVPIFRAAYLDFANSLTRVFKLQPDIWKDMQAFVPIYPVGCVPDLDAMSRMVTAIENLSAPVIEGIIRRIPPAFLLPAHRDEIVKALLYRQPRIRLIMRSSYPALP